MSNVRTVRLTWQDDLRFEGGAPDGPTIPIDGDNATAPGPMQQLLLAAGGCSGADIVSILKKMREDLTGLEIEVRGTRREEHPRRYVDVHFVIRVTGRGLDRDKVQRAVDLSLEKYCSVVHSLRPDIAVTHELVLA